MCSAWRFCLSVYLSLSPLGIMFTPLKDPGGPGHIRPAGPRKDYSRSIVNIAGGRRWLGDPFFPDTDSPLAFLDPVFRGRGVKCRRIHRFGCFPNKIYKHLLPLYRLISAQGDGEWFF